MLHCKLDIYVMNINPILDREQARFEPRSCTRKTLDQRPPQPRCGGFTCSVRKKKMPYVLQAAFKISGACCIQI